MNPTRITPKPASSRYLMSVCIGAISLFVILYVFMTSYVLSHFQGYVDIYLPAKNGGGSFLMSAGWFSTFSVIFVLGLGILTVLVGVMAKRKTQVASLFTVLALFLSATAAATFGGNAFYQLWGAWPSIALVVPLIIVLFIVEFPIILSLADPRSRFVKK